MSNNQSHRHEEGPRLPPGNDGSILTWVLAFLALLIVLIVLLIVLTGL